MSGESRNNEEETELTSLTSLRVIIAAHASNVSLLLKKSSQMCQATIYCLLYIGPLAGKKTRSVPSNTNILRGLRTVRSSKV